MNRLSVEDEARFEDDQRASEPDDSPGPLREALHRFLDALRHLFNAAGAEGQPLTILSLLVRHDDRPDTSAD